MKTIGLFLWAFILHLSLNAQDINWRSLKENQNQVLSLHGSADYGTMYGVSYGRKFSGKNPFLGGVKAYLPFGNHPFDDWKTNINAQKEIWHNNQLSLTITPGINLRRYASQAATFYNIGGELHATFGYFRPRWGAAAEINYDKPLFTHIRHDMLKDYYPQIQDGWYGSTGGNFKIGVKTVYSYKSWGIWMKAGKIYGQNFRDNPTLPFYFEVSLQRFL